MTRPRAADDFATIYQRVRELRGDAAATAPGEEAGEGTRTNPPLTDPDRRLRDRREGLPPPWVPTIFIKKPSNREIARRFWHARSGW